MDDDKTKAGSSHHSQALKLPFNTGLWAESLAVIKRNPKACATYFAASSAIIWLGGDDISDSLSIALEAFISVFLMIPVCFSLLKNDDDASTFGASTNSYIINFMLRTLSLNFIAYGSGAIIAMVMLANNFSTEASSAASLLIYLVMLCIVFSKWGTMLPAIIDDADFTLKAAGARGQKTWSYALANLLVPYVIVIVLFVALIIPVILLGEGDGTFYSPLTGYDFTIIYENVLIALMASLITVMTAVVLTRSYLLAEGRTDA